MKQQQIEKIIEALYSYSASANKEDILQFVTIEELLEISMCKIERLAFRAAWALEHVLLTPNQKLLTEYTSAIVHNYAQSNNWSVLRSYSKLVLGLLKVWDIKSWKEEETEIILHKTFLMLEDGNCPIAVRCNAYDILCVYTYIYDWMHTELLNRMQLDLAIHDSAALRSRFKKVLKRLERIAKS